MEQSAIRIAVGEISQIPISLERDEVQNVTSLEAVLKRDRVIVLSSLVAISMLAWGYMAYLAWDMEHMEMEMAMLHPSIVMTMIL